MHQFFIVIPANAGIQKPALRYTASDFMDSSVRWNDVVSAFSKLMRITP